MGSAGGDFNWGCLGLPIGCIFRFLGSLSCFKPLCSYPLVAYCVIDGQNHSISGNFLTCTFIKFWKNFLPTGLLGTARLLNKGSFSHLHVYLVSKLFSNTGLHDKRMVPNVEPSIHA